MPVALIGPRRRGTTGTGSSVRTGTTHGDISREGIVFPMHGMIRTISTGSSVVDIGRRIILIHQCRCRRGGGGG